MATQDATDTRRDKRRRAILDAAHALFLEKGYAATTLGDIVARSGGSLATLYELFGSKPGLLVEMVTEQCAQITSIIECVAIAACEPDEGLRLIARHMLKQFGDPKGIALLRVVVAEAPRLPKIGRLFYEAGPATGCRIMAGYFAAQASRGALRIDDPEAAAMLFFHMLTGDLKMRLLCGLPADTGDMNGERHIDNVVTSFIRLHLPA